MILLDIMMMCELTTHSGSTNFYACIYTQGETFFERNFIIQVKCLTKTTGESDERENRTFDSQEEVHV